ncbi:hypothetical protein ABIA00_004563 [Bradyrhizobium ottawaense]|uniref:hypothetical protein n=1 Tax=Bradyrhizobium ottawaense TaxID=931866 RepID=UPI0038397983
MILTVELRGGGEDRQVVAFVRILGPEKIAGRAVYADGAVESAGSDGGSSRSAGCVVVHDRGLRIWALLERACAGHKNTEFVAP